MERAEASTNGDESRLCAYLDGLVDELRRLVPVALGPFDAEAIHKSRVATRRLKAALDLLEPVLNDQHRKPLAKVGRRLRRRLGPLRDLDVMLGHLDDIRQNKHAAAVQWLRERLLNERDEKRAKATASNDTPRVLDRLGAWWGLREHVLQAGVAAPTLLAESLHLQLDGFAERAGPLSRGPRAALPGAPPQDPHEVRIAGKALRYTLELAHAAGHALDPGVLRSFKKMQEALGAWHDFVVLTERVMDRSLGAQLPLHDPQLQSSLLELARFTLARAAKELERFRRLWDKSGDAIAAAVRESFPLTRDARAETDALANDVEATVTGSRTGRGPSGSRERPGPAGAGEGSAPAA